jgi:hypothetical protein
VSGSCGLFVRTYPKETGQILPDCYGRLAILLNEQRTVPNKKRHKCPVQGLKPIAAAPGKKLVSDEEFDPVICPKRWVSTAEVQEALLGRARFHADPIGLDVPVL